jgi:hypothetical protein
MMNAVKGTIRTFPNWKRGTVENGVHIVDLLLLESYKGDTNW